MKPMIVMLLIALVSAVAFAVAKKERPEDAWIHIKVSDPDMAPGDVKERLRNQDLSSLWTAHQNYLLGSLGTNHQRLWVHFTSIKKDSSNPLQYKVQGKTKVKANVCDFTGTITVVDARLETDAAVRNEYQDFSEEKKVVVKSRGLIISDCVFDEDPRQKYTGQFQGKLLTRFFVDVHDKAQYDDLDDGRDGYSNNQWLGTWTSADQKISKPCRWGEYRIPMADDLDQGSSEFSPSDAFRKNGWDSFDSNAEWWNDTSWWK